MDIFGGDIPLWVYPLVAWTLFWKARGAYVSARKGHVGWFISFWVINTLGILPLLYLFWFEKYSVVKKPQKKPRKKKMSKKSRLK